jgi:hypothetical protein
MKVYIENKEINTCTVEKSDNEVIVNKRQEFVSETEKWCEDVKNGVKTDSDFLEFLDWLKKF